MKTCIKCEAEKETSEFYVNSSYCKQCDKARNKQWMAENKTRRNTYRRNRTKLPEVKERLYWEQKRKREKDPEKTRQAKAAYYMKNREREQAKARQRYQDNPDYFKENARKRKNRLKSSTQEPYTKQQIYDRDDGLCFLCRELVDLTLKHPNPNCFSFQHAMPLIHGGHDIPDNVLTSHLVCNLRQGTKPFAI